MKLARIVSNQNGVSRRLANPLLAAGRVRADVAVYRDGSAAIYRRRLVKIAQNISQQAELAYHLMLHNHAGYLSATRDDQHPTVMELNEPELGGHLHIGGRLDRASTELLI